MYVACTLIQLEWHFPQRSWACFVLVFVSLEGRVRLQYSRSNTKQMPKNRKCDKAHCREKASLSHAEGAKSMAPEEPCQGLSVLSLGQCGGTDGEGGKPRREGLLVQMAPLNQPAQLFLLIHLVTPTQLPLTQKSKRLPHTSPEKAPKTCGALHVCPATSQELAWAFH